MSPARGGSFARRALLAGVLAAAAIVAPAAHALTLNDIHGHVAFGYSKLFITQAPGGSLSVESGLTIPMRGFGLGADVGLHLLGTRTVALGSEIASVDYSLFEAGLFVRYAPPAFPIANFSAGPEVMSARAVLSTSGGGAAFQALAVEKVVPGLGASVTFMQRRPSPVRVGLEIGTRIAFLPPRPPPPDDPEHKQKDAWKLLEARLAIHY